MKVLNTIKRLVFHGNAYVSKKDISKYEFLDEMGLGKRYIKQSLTPTGKTTGNCLTLEGYIYDANKEQREILNKDYVVPSYNKTKQPIVLEANVNDLIIYKKLGEEHTVLVTSQNYKEPIVLDEVKRIEIRRYEGDDLYFTKFYNNLKTCDGKYRKIIVKCGYYMPMKG